MNQICCSDHSFCLLSVIVHNFNVISIPLMPCETDSPLVVYSDAVLTLAVPVQCFEMIAGRHSQGFQYHYGIQHIQFPQSNAFERFETAACTSCFQASGFLAFISSYHGFRLSFPVI